MPLALSADFYTVGGGQIRNFGQDRYWHSIPNFYTVLYLIQELKKQLSCLQILNQNDMIPWPRSVGGAHAYVSLSSAILQGEKIERWKKKAE